MKDYSFGNSICALRTARGLSQFQLGAMLGVTDKAVSKWENGDSKPRLSTCHRLAEVLGVSVNELLGGAQSITPSAGKELERMNYKLWREAYKRLELYGPEPPAQCWSRLAAEEAALKQTDAIHSVALLGKIKQQLQEQHSGMHVSNVLNSSFAAWLFGATEVNPLPAHYRCPQCGATEFVSGVASGFDLPPKMCSCGSRLIRDGHNITFEGYALAQRKFGTNAEIWVSAGKKPLVFQLIADYYRDLAQVLPVRLKIDDEELVEEYVVILPPDQNKPAVEEDGFLNVGLAEYYDLLDNKIFYAVREDPRYDQLEQLWAQTNAALPEMQTLLTPKMAEVLYREQQEKMPHITEKLAESEIKDFELVLQLDLTDLSSGVWEENAEQLLADDRATFRQLPVAREVVWEMISKALNNKDIRDSGLALQVMETARKGIYCSQGIPEQLEKLLGALDLPEWFPDFLKKVKYLVSKGQGVACLLLELRLKWYQLHYPAEYEKIVFGR